MGAPDAAAGDASVGQSINADAFGPSRMFAWTRECSWSKLLPIPAKPEGSANRGAFGPRLANAQWDVQANRITGRLDNDDKHLAAPAVIKIWGIL